MTTEYKKTRRSHYEAVKKMNNLQKNRREKENQTFGRLGRRFGSRASQAAGLPPSAHRTTTTTAARQRSSPTDLTIQARLCACVCPGWPRTPRCRTMRARAHAQTHRRT